MQGASGVVDQVESVEHITYEGCEASNCSVEAKGFLVNGVFVGFVVEKKAADRGNWIFLDLIDEFASTAKPTLPRAHSVIYRLSSLIGKDDRWID